MITNISSANSISCTQVDKDYNVVGNEKKYLHVPKGSNLSTLKWVWYFKAENDIEAMQYARKKFKPGNFIFQKTEIGFKKVGRV